MPLETKIKEYNGLVSTIGGRIKYQDSQGQPLNLDSALEGFELNPREKFLLHNFAERYYFHLKYKEDQIKRYLEKTDLDFNRVAITAITAAAVGGGIAYTLSNNILISTLVASQLFTTTLILELHYKLFTKFFAYLNSRDLSGLLNVKTIEQETVQMLNGIE